MRWSVGFLTGLVLTTASAAAQDYSTSGGKWDYSNGQQRAAPVESYEGYPPLPTQVIISPGTGGGYGGSSYYGGGNSQGRVGGVGRGNTGAGNIGAGNTGAGNISPGNLGGLPGRGGWSPSGTR